MQPTKSEEKALRIVVKEFRRNGILLESDADLPSVTSLVVGRAVRGSWWGHPDGRRVWKVLNRFCNRHDVLTVKLVSGKVTFVHRRLWPELLAVCTSKESWQTTPLSADATALLGTVERKEKIRTDSTNLLKNTRRIADAARELEKRLLIHGEEVHTAKGRHAKVLRSWKRWMKEADFSEELPETSKSKRKFDKILRRLNDAYGAGATLPWDD